MKLKYLIIDSFGIEVPIVFPEILTHDAVAKAFDGLVVSAGLCERAAVTLFNEASRQWRCKGKSVSLEVNSRGDVDARILNDIMP